MINIYLILTLIQQNGLQMEVWVQAIYNILSDQSAIRVHWLRVLVEELLLLHLHSLTSVEKEKLLLLQGMDEINGKYWRFLYRKILQVILFKKVAKVKKWLFSLGILAVLTILSVIFMKVTFRSNIQYFPLILSTPCTISSTSSTQISFSFSSGLLYSMRSSTVLHA